MSYEADPIERDTNGNSIPQYYNDETDSFEALKGRDGAQFVLQVGKSKHATVETSATTSNVPHDFDVNMIVMLANDGSDDIKVNFDADTSAAGAWTLKAGEAVTNVPRACKKIHVKALNGSPAFRAWGV